MTDDLTVESPAKINWFLRVIGRRPDGFHEIASWVTPISLVDRMVFHRLADRQVRLECDDPTLPLDERNLVFKAARLLQEETGCSLGVSCFLSKRIPAGGGLGGGSSNAAFALTALNRLWGLELSIERLAGLAARLGSDVCGFLGGGSVMMSGRGEHIQPRPLPWSGWIVLIIPPFPVATADVYRTWRRPSIPVAETPLEAWVNNGLGRVARSVEWMSWTFNMLEEPATTVSPRLAEVLASARALADRPVRVSGSGSTIFTAFDERPEADAYAQAVSHKLAVRTEVVQPVEPSIGSAG